ncbi:MAG TPA: IS630 family transposase [Anaerolineae bacterium]|nr:IS630 family transposase [Anaerolineae bacterium]
MNLSIHFRNGTVKALTQRLEEAYRWGNARLVRRITALLDFAQQIPVATIARRSCISETSVYRWLSAFLLDGYASLVYRRSPGRPAKLAKLQKTRLRQLITAGPEKAGYPTGCWSRLLIQNLIEREFGVLYDEAYVCELLRHLGFSFQKARFVSDHLDEEARRVWMQQKWPKILRRAQRTGALLLFEDEASFAQWGSLGYTWAPVGQQPVVKTTGKRKGYKVFGALEYFTGRFFYHGSSERFTAATYQAYLLTILAQTDQPIILIQDGAKYHTSKEMQQFFAHQPRLTVHQLPSYSPDYNPIEFLWKNLKRRATHNRYFPEFETLITSVAEALVYYAQHAAEVKQLLGAYCHDKLITGSTTSKG